MTVSAQYRLARRRSPEPAPRLFRLGQMVRMKSHFGLSPATADLYQITGMMPPVDNSPQYRIRNDGERHERVATEDSLEPVDLLPAGNDATLIERTFGNGQGTEAQQQGTTKTEAGEGSVQA